LSPARQTVLYAPTFSTAGSLQVAGTVIVQALLDTGANVIVKLHDRSAVPHAKHTGGVDWPARFRPLEATARFALAKGADSGPYLSAADVLVTDHSSVGFEFALLDRPLVIYDAPALKDAARIDADKWDLLRSMGTVVETPSHLQEAVKAALACPERGREARRQAHALFAHAGHATGRALAVVYDLLELDAPSPDGGLRDTETRRPT
jgi:CDP-glycerol glycerophosphotransferase